MKKSTRKQFCILAPGYQSAVNAHVIGRIMQGLLDVQK